MDNKDDSDSFQGVFLIGNWQFHSQLCRLERGQQSVKLEPRVTQLLSYLVSKAGTPVDRETIIKDVWPGTIVGDEALSNTINKLRKAFGDDRHNPQVIETIPKVGYRLIAPVRPIESETPSNEQIIPPTEKATTIRRGFRPLFITIFVLGIFLILALAGIKYIDSNRKAISPAQTHVPINSSPIQDIPPSDSEPEARRTIAVLPFENLNKDPEQDYFSDGMTDDLITDLSHLSSLNVIARNSVFAYKGRSQKVQEIAQELGATHVLEGSVRRAGNRIRINAQFIDASTGHHLWAERYDGELNNIFELQDDISKKIVAALKIKLTNNEKSNLEKRYTNNIEAYDLFLKGLQQFVTYTREGNREARKYYQMAIDHDPNFARAYANLGWTYARDFQDGWTETPVIFLDKAMKLTLEAKRLDQTSARVHWILGQILLYKKQYEQAIKHVTHAIELNPNNPDQKILLARVYIFSGDPTKSIELINEAIESNPIYPMQYQMNLGIAHFANGDYSRAEKALVIAAERNPDAQRVRMWLVATYANAGDLESANWELTELLSINPTFTVEALQHSIPFKDESIRDRLFSGIKLAYDT